MIARPVQERCQLFASDTNSCVKEVERGVHGIVRTDDTDQIAGWLQDCGLAIPDLRENDKNASIG